jgi:hypothetical protein
MTAPRDPLPNFRDFCERACIKLWGQPSKRGQKELRWDGVDGYSGKTFSLAKRAWYDHAAGWGGSTFDLVAHAKGFPKQGLKGQAFFDAWREAHAMGLVPISPPEKGNGGGGPIVATYDYHDEAGQLLFQVVRFDTANPDDRFRQRRPDGNGGWIWDTKGIRTHVLYRLPQLIEAMKATQRVLVTEGERDANTAVALGYAATTIPGGVGKWRAEYEEFFRGADVVIVSDNDLQSRDPQTGAPQFHPNGKPVLPGQDHAATVLKYMCKVVAHARLIIFPQKDLTAWREAGGTSAALDALIEAAPNVGKQPPPPDHDAEIERLARLSPIDFDRERKAAAGRLGIRVSTLIRLVEAKRAFLFAPTIPDRSAPGGAKEVLAQLNADHAVVIVGARTRVLRFEDTPHGAGGEHYVYRLPTFLRFDDFRNFYLNRRTVDADGKPFAVDADGNPITIGQWWLEHSLRRQYRGVVFRPGGEPVIDDRLNLWTGFGVEPKRGEWGRMKAHIFEVLAARDDAVNNYILNWQADAVQRPDRQAEAALALLGGVGTGKGLLGRAMCRIFGQHGRHISCSEHLTGKFNAHMQMCCFLFADEAFAPQDKKAEGALKRLVTEDTLFIEPKGVDPFEVPNRLHVMLASNHEWVIPASEKERRYVVQNVAAAHQQDETWFKPIYEEMRSGGLQAMMYDLLDRNLGDWRPPQDRAHHCARQTAGGEPLPPRPVVARTPANRCPRRRPRRKGE